MNTEQLLIKDDFIKEDKNLTFTGWPKKWIVGYYLQFFYKSLSTAEIAQAIDAACSELIKANPNPKRILH